MHYYNCGISNWNSDIMNNLQKELPWHIPPYSQGNGYFLMEDNETHKIEIRSLITVVLILAELTSQLSIRLITIP